MSEEKLFDIMGTPYTFSLEIQDEDPCLARDDSIDGYCDSDLKRLVVARFDNPRSWKRKFNENWYQAHEKYLMRHEVIHAYLFESGLGTSAGVYNRSWSMNEEMIDWFALNLPKINRTIAEIERYMDWIYETRKSEESENGNSN